MPRIFSPLPDKPDHGRLELDLLETWDREGTFEKLREQNRGGPKFSFIDGPITANNPMGVHHAWGRTLKDVFQRYKALRGFDQRYQNGFDCQGLWVEVEVEKALGLNSKREIEEYGLAEFADRCIERVAHYSEVITEQSRRLGMWMDWDRDYYTFTDTNIEYIWRFLAAVHERGWLYQGHRSTVWCPRCGTSISQHEVFSGEYKELEHPSLTVRFPLKDREGQSLAIWTTTPWTLPANVAAAVQPDAEYILREDGVWVARELDPEATAVQTARGSELVGLEYEGPFDHLPAQEGVVHRVIPWDDVSLSEGTGIVHIATGAGSEDFELGRIHGLPVLAPLDESGRMLPGFGFDGLSTDEVAQPVIDDLERRGLLLESGRIVHRYPTCWRCGTPLVFRVVDDWFIACDEIRQPMLDANATVEWTPAFYSKRMDDWLRNMGDWNISRKRYFGLPLPFYPCEDCGTLTVIGSRKELEERALSRARPAPRAPPPVDRRGADRVLRLRRGGAPRPGGRRRVARRGHRPALDARLRERRVRPRGVRDRRGQGADEGRPARPRVLGAVVPGGLGLGDARADPALVLLDLVHVGDAHGQSPYRRVLTYEKLLDETGREMHRSWGNAIAADDALAKMGADVMRWQYTSQPPSQNLLFGYGPAHEIRRRLLTLWNSARFLVDYANIQGWTPSYADLDGGPTGDLQPLDRWLVSRTNELVRETTEAYESYLTVNVVRAFETFVEDLSNWYIRRSRRRFWDGDDVALRTLWYALVQGLRVVAPIMPFLSRPPVAHAGDARRGRPGVGPPRRLAGGPGARCRAPRRGRRAPAGRRARPAGALVGRASRCGSRCASSSSRARRSPTRTSTRSPRSCACSRSSSARSTRASCG